MPDLQREQALRDGRRLHERGVQRQHLRDGLLGHGGSRCHVRQLRQLRDGDLFHCALGARGRDRVAGTITRGFAVPV